MPLRKNLAKIIIFIAEAVLGIVLLLLPSGYFLVSYQYLSGNLEAEAVLKAKQVSDLIKDNPEGWEFQKIRLEGLFLVDRGLTRYQGFSILNNRQEEVYANSEQVVGPVLKKSAEFYDAGNVLGHVEISRSLRPLLIRTGFVLLFILPFGAAAFIIMRTIPLRSIEFSERALRQSEEKFRDLFENANDAIFIVNSNLNYIDINKKATEMLGYSKDEFLRMKVSDIMTPEHAAGAGPGPGGLRGNGTSNKFFGRAIAKDGRFVDVEVSTSAILEGDTVTGSRDIIRDITERRKMEEELLKSQKLDSLGLMAGGIAHDFNNLLTGILGNISVARLHISSNDSAYIRLAEAERACLRAKDLAKQLLTFSVGGEPIKKVVNIGALIRESANLILRGSSMRCEFSIPDDLWAVEVDEGQFSQVINNVVINAMQASPAGTRIAISCENIILRKPSALSLPEGEYVLIKIQDFGMGILKEHLQKIFDPYFSTKNSGRGLGLATAYSIAKKHGGLIFAESELASGATFSIYVPASADKKFTEAEEETDFCFTGKGKILIMDDEEIVRDVASEMLREMNYTVEVACDGSESIEMFTRARSAGNPYDLVILDLTVPGGLGGKQVIQRLLEIDPGVRAIVSSGYSHDPVMADYRSYGFRGVVSKPYRIRELGEAVYSVLEEVQDQRV